MSTTLQQCQEFLAAIFEPHDVIEFRPIKPTAKQWHTTCEMPAVVEWLQRLNERGAQCYFGANPRKQAGESKEDGVALARCLYADFDDGVTVEEAWSRIKAAGLPMPTVTIVTGGGVHCWWRLDQPITDRKLHGRLLKTLAAVLPSDEAGTSGWPRIMRLPGFVNTKYEHKPVAELVDVDASRVYSLAELTPATKSMSDSSRAFIECGSLASTAGRRETMFAAACDLRDRGWAPAAAEAVLMPRMRQFDFGESALADMPRQIHNAWNRPPRAIATPAMPATQATQAASSTSSPVEAYKPFPVDALPEPLAAFVAEAAAAVGCDEAYVALPALTATGAAIGTTRRVELKAGYAAPPILWTAIVGESGTAKTPALNVTLEHVRQYESLLREEARRELDEYADRLELYEKSRDTWRKSKQSEEEPPRRPQEPTGRRALIVDSTVEALAVVLADNPRGLLLGRDELAGWLGSMDRYAGKSSGGGSDEAFFLSAYNGIQHDVDRRTGGRRTIHVRQAALWIAGGIQPAVLQRHLGTERRESGLLARLLLAAPPPRPQTWSEAEVSFFTKQAFNDTLDKLYRLEPGVDAEGRERPRLVRLSSEAKRLWVEFHDEHAAELAGYVGDLAAAWSKLRDTCARLALIVHEVRRAAGEDISEDILDAASMGRAIRLIDWFKYETRRVYVMLAESDVERAARQADDRLAAWIMRQGGTATARDAVGGCRWIATSDDAEAALGRLADAGCGHWIDKPTDPTIGGRPTRLFVLAQEARKTLSASAQPSESRPKQGFGYADAAGVAGEEYVEI